MRYVTVHLQGRVCRAPEISGSRAPGHKHVTVGITANVLGESVQANAVGYADIADQLLSLRIGDTVELDGLLVLRTRVDENDVASAAFDVKARRMLLVRNFPRAAALPVT